MTLPHEEQPKAYLVGLARDVAHFMDINHVTFSDVVFVRDADTLIDIEKPRVIALMPLYECLEEVEQAVLHSIEHQGATFEQYRPNQVVNLG